MLDHIKYFITQKRPPLLYSCRGPLQIRFVSIYGKADLSGRRRILAQAAIRLHNYLSLSFPPTDHGTSANASDLEVSRLPPWR